MTYDLKGRLEKVDIIGEQSPHWAYGQLTQPENNGKVIYVHGANHHIGRVSLARFTLQEPKAGYKQLSHFITSEVPHKFTGLPPQDYVLVGRWTEDMQKRGDFPTLREVKQHFNPGNLRSVLFFKGDYVPGEPGARIGRERGQHTQLPLRSYVQAIRKQLPGSRKSARLVLTESEGELEKIMMRIENHGLVPVEMDPRPSTPSFSTNTSHVNA